MGDLEVDYKKFYAEIDKVDVSAWIDTDPPQPSKEELLRQKHPGLQEKWEEYQAYLALVKE